MRMGADGNLRSSRATSSGPFAETSQQMFAFVRKQLSADAVVVFFKPRAMRLLTDRQSVRVREVPELMQYDYLCVYAREPDNPVQRGTVDGLVAEGMLRPVYANADFALYRIVTTDDVRAPHP